MNTLEKKFPFFMSSFWKTPKLNFVLLHMQMWSNLLKVFTKKIIFYFTLENLCNSVYPNLRASSYKITCCWQLN